MMERIVYYIPAVALVAISLFSPYYPVKIAAGMAIVVFVIMDRLIGKDKNKKV
jgi:hypothetical protein